MISILNDLLFCQIKTSPPDVVIPLYFQMIVRGLVIVLDIYWLKRIFTMLEQWGKKDLFLSQNKFELFLPIFLILGGNLASLLGAVDIILIMMLFMGFMVMEFVFSRIILIRFMPRHLKIKKSIILYSEISGIKVDKFLIRFSKNDQYYESFQRDDFSNRNWYYFQERTRRFAQENNIPLKEA